MSNRKEELTNKYMDQYASEWKDIFATHKFDPNLVERETFRAIAECNAELDLMLEME